VVVVCGKFWVWFGSIENRFSVSKSTRPSAGGFQTCPACVERKCTPSRRCARTGCCPGNDFEKCFPPCLCYLAMCSTFGRQNCDNGFYGCVTQKADIAALCAHGANFPKEKCQEIGFNQARCGLGNMESSMARNRNARRFPFQIPPPASVPHLHCWTR